MGVVASLAAAAVLVLVLAALSFTWAGRSGRALDPVPANPTTTRTPFQAPPSDLQLWIDDLPTGAPPATPYWHDGTLYVNGEQIPAPYGTVDIEVAGDTILVGGFQGDTKYVGPSEWGLVRGDRLEPLPVPADAQVGLSVDGRIVYWIVGTDAPNTKQFFTWDTEPTAPWPREPCRVVRLSCGASTPPETATGRKTRTPAPSPDGTSARTRSRRPT